MFSKSVLGIAGVCILFLGYCVYFDHKRRSNPNFKKMLKEKRLKAKPRSGKARLETEIQEDAQAFLFQQFQLFGESMAKGDMDGCVDHLCRGLSVCQQPEMLLQYIQQTIPPNVYENLAQRLVERQKLQLQPN